MRLGAMSMRTVLAVGLLLLLLGASGIALAGDTYVRGYVRKDGTYVQPHFRAAPDGNVWNNYSTRGNVNPYTGQPGTTVPYRIPGGSAGGMVQPGWSTGSGSLSPHVPQVSPYQQYTPTFPRSR